MVTSLSGRASPVAGFEAPLEMLASCHGRIEQQCQTLRRLLAHLPVHGADRQAQEAAAAVMRYFDSAARHHHEDEEEDLFPALLESMAGSDARCLRDMTQALSDEHRRLDLRWQRLRAMIEALAAGRSAWLDAAVVDDFIAAQLKHVAREDAELLPMATCLLGDDALRDIGRAMRERRGIAAGLP